MPLCTNYWVYERNFCMLIKSKVLDVEWQVFFVPFSVFHVPFAYFEVKLIENLLPLGLEHDEHHFNKRPEYA